MYWCEKNKIMIAVFEVIQTKQQNYSKNLKHSHYFDSCKSILMWLVLYSYSWLCLIFCDILWYSVTFCDILWHFVILCDRYLKHAASCQLKLLCSWKQLKEHRPLQPHIGTEHCNNLPFLWKRRFKTFLNEILILQLRVSSPWCLWTLIVQISKDTLNRVFDRCSC